MSAPNRSLPPSAPSAADWIDYGRHVVLAEARALAELAPTLEEGFAKAVALVLATSGRVIVTGMGKSGHVARKAASTLASVAIPSLFVHPAEAAHGDLGMLAGGDSLIVFSNSGATRELVAIVRHARALAIPIVAISSQAHSLLMAECDICLLLPGVIEAGAASLAPTTSTAMMMALGDAIAMTAMRARGLSRDGFGALHPGGAIGSRLSRVTALMHSGARMPLVDPDAPMREVVITMTASSLGIAGVCDAAGRLVGVITDGDLRRHVDALLVSTAREVMTHAPITLPSESLAEDALTLMNQHKITAIFVTDDDDPRRPVGLVHIHDLLRLGVT